jgi:hypothetical protein
MSLPKSWVDALFAKLSIRYGSSFLAQWQDADPELIKDDWADVLSGFSDKPWAIKAALDHLPVDKPPNAMHFRMLCNAAQPAIVARLPEPPVDPAKRRAAIEMALAAVRRMP